MPLGLVKMEEEANEKRKMNVKELFILVSLPYNLFSLHHT